MCAGMTAAVVSPPVPNADGDIELSPEAGRQVFARINRPDFTRWATQVTGTGGCSHPVRLVGSTARVDVSTGEVLGAYESVAEPDHVSYVCCGNRRADVCPSCSAEYAGDLWHQLSAGMVGGKGVPDEIGQHPLVFATVTAPSFGAVNTCSKPARAVRRCRRRGRPGRCARTAARRGACAPTPPPTPPAGCGGCGVSGVASVARRTLREGSEDLPVTLLLQVKSAPSPRPALRVTARYCRPQGFKSRP